MAAVRSLPITPTRVPAATLALPGTLGLREKVPSPGTIPAQETRRPIGHLASLLARPTPRLSDQKHEPATSTPIMSARLEAHRSRKIPVSTVPLRQPTPNAGAPKRRNLKRNGQHLLKKIDS